MIRDSLPKYVISLISRDKRRDSFTESAIKAGITNYKFYPAIRGASKKEKQKGCRLSHKRVIQLAQDLHQDHVLIMEDDAHFLSIPNLTIPQDWDMFYYGAYHYNKPEPISDNIAQCTYALSTVCYVVRSTIYKLILSHLDKDQPVDMIYATRIQPRVKAYCCHPSCVIQSSGYSDIESKSVNYSKYYDNLH